MDKDDLIFANDPQGAIDRTGSGMAWITIMLVAAMIAAAIVWAYFAEIEQTTSGLGKVIPTSQVQVVESLDAGIVAEIMVDEGANVEPGQALLRIDDTGNSAKLGELDNRRSSLVAELARLRAEASEAETFVTPDKANEEMQELYSNQVQIFNVNRSRLNELSSARQQKLVQRQQSLVELEGNISKHEGSRDLLSKELNILEKLLKRKAVAEIEVLRMRRKVLENGFDLKILNASKAKMEAEIEEMKTLLNSDKTAYLSEVHSRISIVNTEISVVDESIKAAKDRVTRAILRAPIGGIVNQLDVVNVGEVVKPGVMVAEIVPLDEKFLIEARIRPKDIGFISPGLPATIRLSAYDYTKFGTLKGKVERIGADTITSENNETFYQVIITTEADQTEEYKSQIKVIPGMIANIDIATGKRSVLDYLVKPFLRLGDRALRDPN